ncbi:Hypothetical protein UVM_LOCUS203 [uncultured virus]|nr:Hypothetical protein UVM_LOCUS203 [uncultured virus]
MPGDATNASQRCNNKDNDSCDNDANKEPSDEKTQEQHTTGCESADAESERAEARIEMLKKRIRHLENIIRLRDEKDQQIAEMLAKALQVSTPFTKTS